MRSVHGLRRILSGARRLSLTACLLAAAACTATTPATDALRRDGLGDGTPRRAELTEVPFHAQTDYHCGPAALATVLQDAGIAATPDGIADAVFTPGRKGSLQTDMQTGARRQGAMTLPVHSIAEALRQVDQGRPVLVLQNLALEMAPQWHYAVLVGYDLDDGTVVLRSGQDKRRITDMGTFEHTWRRSGFWGFVLADPSAPPPAFATVSDWIGEAAGLERASRPERAEAAYRTALKTWPDAWQPWVAFANLRFQEGNLDSAEANLREARNRAPDNWIVLNNLAYTLLKNGKPRAALPIAEKAVAMADATQAEHAVADARATLQEIKDTLTDTSTAS
ncbi:PA2778 family cysteine peptidase [Rhodospirillaceae bacterium KN72]|uniref:PA2778 family cysteine peptidase n=1 Tax=Pacificispira spongiicola TaxID=2729598 RepID=A0A7Y0HFY0_9PROT|nr:PA2778 family cysteine peptidase [Pacificispira spongiicola]NMM43764.1 PA2778 family cysteine peptidase [Pacificispira spongiicola]